VDAYSSVDNLLTSRYGIGLEEALCDGCLVGRVQLRLSNVARIVPRRVRYEVEDDGGEAGTYDGVLILEDVWYRFRCQVFVDGSGLRFLSEIQQFEVVQWQVRLPMSKAG
jgi:hypothetical protein